jgi:hypothetical protein
MRKWVIPVGAALAFGLSSLPPANSATATAGSGRYLVPFREDHARYVSGAFTGGRYAGQDTDGNGCVTNPPKGAPAGNPNAYNCLPAAATLVQLGDGRLLYWDALEGSENLAGTYFVVPDGGRLTVNDQSRVLTLGGPNGNTPFWATPTPRDGGGHNTSTDEDLPLPAPLAATHYPYNNGSLFCSDQVLLSDGSVLTAGGTDY